jgi:hypothetical protein
MYLPAWGASRCRRPTQREAVGDRVNTKPLDPGHRPAPQAPLMLVNPSSSAKSARRAWHAQRPPFCRSPPGMKMGSDSPGQLMPFPCKSRSGRVINGDEFELPSREEIRRRGCDQPSTMALPRRHMAKDHGTREEGKSFHSMIIFSRFVASKQPRTGEHRMQACSGPAAMVNRAYQHSQFLHKHCT